MELLNVYIVHTDKDLSPGIVIRNPWIRLFEQVSSFFLKSLSDISYVYFNLSDTSIMYPALTLKIHFLRNKQQDRFALATLIFFDICGLMVFVTFQPIVNCFKDNKEVLA